MSYTHIDLFQLQVPHVSPPALIKDAIHDLVLTHMEVNVFGIIVYSTKLGLSHPQQPERCKGKFAKARAFPPGSTGSKSPIKLQEQAA